MSTVKGQPPREFTEADPATVLKSLGLQPPLPVVVIIGGAGNLDQPSGDKVDGAKLEQIREGIELTMLESLRAAVLHTHAVVLTGGTDAGVMRLAGRTSADAASALIGVVPTQKVKGDSPEAILDANHTAAVLTSGARWGSETKVLFEIAEAVTGGTAPGVVVLANGGAVSFEEARRFLRGGWPIVTVTGSGGAAQDLVDAVSDSEGVSNWGDLKQADVESLAQDRSMARRQLVWRLHPDDILKSAWATFASYDLKAKTLKNSAKRSRWLLTGLASILLVAITSTVQFAALGWTAADGSLDADLGREWFRSLLEVALTISKWTVLALPIGIAVAVALGSSSGSQVKWRLHQCSAETLSGKSIDTAPAEP